MIGCSYNAKQSALISLIPESIQYGAEFYSSAFVKNIVFKKEKAEKAEGIFIDFSTSRGIGRFEVFADVFVLCAGAIHSPNILFHSDHKFPENVGRFLSLQPQLPVMALFDEELTSYRGIPQAVFCNQFEEVNDKEGYGGFRIESIMVGPAMGSGFLPEIGRKAQNFMKNFHKIAAVLVLFPDKPSGFLKRWNTNQPIIYYEMKEELKKRIKKGLKEAAKIFLEAGAKEVLLPFEEVVSVKRKEEIDKIDKIEFKPGLIKSISAHPQGTLRMSMKDGAVDSNFRLKGVSNLYVCDSSIFPTTSSSHIMLPIYSFAKVCASRILRSL
jgi:choline dehydrogenase-like flavoprotein